MQLCACVLLETLKIVSGLDPSVVDRTETESGGVMSGAYSPWQD